MSVSLAGSLALSTKPTAKSAPATARPSRSRRQNPARRFAPRLLAWWETHGRKDLPWQNPRTPYRVWVSEIMLQQTQAGTVAAYFERFVARFGNVRALAQADLDDVLHLWSGLGYYARARNLHRAAAIVMRDHDGALPRDPAVLETLPGIGRSTAGAIVAQAHNVRAPILDANAKRVLARHFLVSGAPSSAATQKALWALADAVTPAGRAADYTQAIMDLGATVCRPRQPRCRECPLRRTCGALAANAVGQYPARTKRPARPLKRRRFFVVTDAAGACYMEQRPTTGVWGGLWSPPEGDAEETPAGFLAARRMDAKLVDAMFFGPVFRHGFSHFDLDVEPVFIHLLSRPPSPRGGVWFDPCHNRLGLSVVAAKLVAATTPLTALERK